jgi:7-carboxy-7-deazaguanine synthase
VPEFNGRKTVSTGRKSTYRVKAVWKTLQGEGLFAGRPAVFVRFTGCNMWSGYERDRQRDADRNAADCPLWCDTDFTREGSTSYSAVDLARLVADTGGSVRFCVLTGGEPLLQADAPLIRALHSEGFQVAVETNGSVTLEQAFRDEATGGILAPDWIVCSPKLPESSTVIEYFDELKLVVPDYKPSAYEALVARARCYDAGGRVLPLLWLQPEDGPRYEAARRMAIDCAIADPRWRVSVQTHKVLGVD